MILGVLVAGLLVLALNPHLVADQVMDWAKQNVKDPSVPDILFDTGRACQFLQDGDTAIVMYNYLYQTYPDKADLCAPAMYYCGQIKADSGYIKVFRMQALPYLQIILDQYSDQAEWVSKAQALMSEVNTR